MKDDNTEPVALLEQSQALSAYLASLFREPAHLVAESMVAAATETATPPQIPAGPVPVEPQPQVTPPAVAAVAVEPVPVATETPTIDSLAASGPFASLLVRVDGVRLAIPLRNLFGIRRQGNRLTRLPDSPSWMLGLLNDRNARIQVVDAAALLDAGAGHGPRADDSAAGGHVVILAKDRWGMNCETIEHVVKVDPGQVRWRANRSRRPWFAGVLPAELCTLIDVPALVAWLDRGAPSP